MAALVVSSSPYAEAHKSPSGPGDARPTARQIIEDNDLIGKLADKTFLVTGGTAGIGLETVYALARTGANVFFTARDDLRHQPLPCRGWQGQLDEDG